MRPWLRGPRQLLIAVGAAAARARHQAPDDRHQRHGARGHGGRRRPGHRRDLCRQDHRPRESRARARIVVMAASACETARLLLNSKSSHFPQGLGNSSGVVGKYLTDTTGTSVRGFIPRMMNGVPHNEDGASGSHLYMPWWVDNKKLDFPRGYHIELGGGRRMPGFGTLGGVHLYNGTGATAAGAGGGYGKQLKDDYRRFYGATVGFSGRGEMIPNENSLPRDRSNGRGSLGHSGAALPLEVDRPRAQAGSLPDSRYQH